MDIDKLFKMPKLPPGGLKRKFSDNPTPEMLKKMRTGSPVPSPPLPDSESSKTHVQTTKHRVTMEEMEENDGPFAPGGDADYFIEEDEEGRFYGGGLTSEQKTILNIFDGASEPVTNDGEVGLIQIRRLLLNFERSVNKNQDQRSKYANDPTKFIDSEADLDISIKTLLTLSQSPVLAYPELLRSGTMSLLVGLLTHENMDIVIDVVEVIHELTDEDADAEDDEGESDAVEEALNTLVAGLVENSTLELLVDNLSRLNETEEADRQGIFHILGIFENMIGFQPSISMKLVSKTKILSWLLERIQQKAHDENRGYAAELLSILLQNTQVNRLAFGKQDGIEILLKSLSQYRRRDPVDAEETEFMENLFDILCSALDEPTSKQLFLAAEGLDLMILMMKEKRVSRSRSIKVLDYAMSGPAGEAICEDFIDILGLKTLFTALMGKSSKQHRSQSNALSTEDTAHILGIISSLFAKLESDSPSRIRLLAKFVEGEYEKVDKLLEIRENARKRLWSADTDIEEERQQLIDEEGTTVLAPELEDGFYLKRLDSGLFTLQTVDYILAWLILEDDGIRGHALHMLDRGNQSIADIIQTLRLYYEHVDDVADAADTIHSQKDVLHGLISTLEATESPQNIL